MPKIAPYLVVSLACLFAAGNAAAVSGSQAACSWRNPGHDPYRGDVVAAVDRYQDIPAALRSKLKARMARRDYDEIVSIRRDGIDGRARYGAEIRDMHFGAGRVCATVDRSAWAADAQERGMVYCEGEQCILVPTVCRNVSRISRTGRDEPAAARGATPAGAEPAALAVDQVAAAGTESAGVAHAAGAPGAAEGSWTAAAGGVPLVSSGAAADGTAPLPLPRTQGGVVVPDGGVPPMAWSDGPLAWDAGLAPPVPEPGSWAQMLGGLLGLGWFLRRRAGAGRINPA